MLDLPRVIAINDLSGFGKCALSIAIPAISACGAEVCPLPTAVLSTNMKFRGFSLQDLTPLMPSYINHWQSIGLKTTAVYIGFLSSYEQAWLLNSFIDSLNPPITIVDPIMGDNGVAYKSFTPALCDALKSMVSKADIVLPNLTEACLLCGEEYNESDVAPSSIKELAKNIFALGAKHVIIKGIVRKNKLYNCLYNEEGYIELEYDLLPFKMFGTGDLFASVFIGKLLTGNPIEQSIHTASEFTSLIMKESRKYDDYENRGLCFEPYLYMLKP